MTDGDYQEEIQRLRAKVAALTADNAALVAALTRLADAVPAAHFNPTGVRALLAEAHPGTALLEEHRKALEAAPFSCCGGSDESPPQHTQDCHINVRARNEGFEAAASAVELSGAEMSAASKRRVAAAIRALKTPEASDPAATEKPC